MSKQHKSLGRVELQVLQYVTEHPSIKVGDVAEHFATTAGKARTTVLTVMERLRTKGHLTRKKVASTWHYSPKVAKPVLMQRLVGRFVDESLGGSLAPFMAYLASQSNALSDEELVKLKQLIRGLEAERSGE